MVTGDRLESSLVAAIVVEDGSTGMTPERISGVAAAMEMLERAGLLLVLVDGITTEVTVMRKEDRRRRWWRVTEEEKR